MAFPARFERAAFHLGGERSILLSYGNRVVFSKVSLVLRAIAPCLEAEDHPRARRLRAKNTGFAFGTLVSIIFSRQKLVNFCVRFA